MNEEVLNVVKSSPKWKPAKISGSEIRTNVRITVEFD